MKETPISFSEPAARALRAGVQTLTRRLMRPQPEYRDDAWYWASNAYDNGMGVHYFHTREFSQSLLTAWARACPYGRVGDRLWVRETHWIDEREPDDLVIYADAKTHKYQRRDIEEACDAACTVEFLRAHEFWRQRSSQQMPRWASRIVLEIVEVRVEHVQDIRYNVAALTAAGVELSAGDAALSIGLGIKLTTRYKRQWNALYSSIGCSYESNPFVWSIAFRRVDVPRGT